MNCKLEGRARSGTFLRGRPQAPDDDGIIAALLNGTGQRPSQQLDAHYVRPLARALSDAGIRPSNKHRQVGDYRLGKLLAEGEGFQDFAAQHVSIESVYRRVRIYTVASATSPEARAAQVRQARREFEVLEGIDHPGILRCKDYKESELGPAMQKVVQAAGRVLRTPEDRGWLWLLDDRYLQREVAGLLPTSWGLRQTARGFETAPAPEDGLP